MKYFAFISYKRGGVDEQIANWIHSKLEKYPYPQELVTPENRPNHDKLLRNIFIDTKDLHVSENPFTVEIKTAIEKSRYLLLICSNNSVSSEYVNQEVSYFLETHDNDHSKILPIFIDKINGCLPHALRESDILMRNCPIYNTFLSETNEMNLGCFYQIVAFLLKVDFKDIYDRYKRYAERKKRQRRWLRYGINTMALLIMALMSFGLITSSRIVKQQREIVELEKEIFPYSVVTGYVKNFLNPVVQYFKNYEPDAHIFVHMPTRVADLNDNHRYRFDEVSTIIEKRLSLDSLSLINLRTSMPRGSNVHKMYSMQNVKLNHNYIDFATTTTTFMEIAKIKKKKDVYADVDLDDMIEEYTDTFIKQANQILGADSVYVSFVKSLYEVEVYCRQ